MSQQSNIIKTMLFGLLIFVVFATHPTTGISHSEKGWKKFANGLEYKKLKLPFKSNVGKSRLSILRINPNKIAFHAIFATQHTKRKRTASDWRKRKKMLATINLGMFQQDHLRNVGYACSNKHYNHKKWNKKYMSVFVFGRKNKKIPHAQILDLSHSGTRQKLKYYKSIIQNLRLIKSVQNKGKSVWSKQKNKKKWSEAALAMDKKGRILFLFTRSPYSMYQFNKMLLSLPLGIIRAMHLEGGPEASLSFQKATKDIHLCGSYETNFNQNDKNKQQWPVPNVIGIQIR